MSAPSPHTSSTFIKGTVGAMFTGVGHPLSAWSLSRMEGSLPQMPLHGTERKMAASAENTSRGIKSVHL